mgnify:CR=1 FL=1
MGSYAQTVGPKFIFLSVKDRVRVRVVLPSVAEKISSMDESKFSELDVKIRLPTLPYPARRKNLSMSHSVIHGPCRLRVAARGCVDLRVAAWICAWLRGSAWI